MKITLYTDYALRVLIYLAITNKRRVTVREISTSFEISKSHLMKVVNDLIRAGFVTGVRGKGGGLQLGVSPSNISVGAIIRIIEGIPSSVDCNAGLGCKLLPQCQLRVILQTAQNAYLAVLDKKSLESLLPQSAISLAIDAQRSPALSNKQR